MVGKLTRGFESRPVRSTSAASSAPFPEFRIYVRSPHGVSSNPPYFSETPVPNVGTFHPQVVHFVIALLFVGVGFRVLSLIKRNSWLSPAATALILLGALATVAGVRTGTDAHGPVERIPGARNAVVEHEEWGIRTRNIFLAIGAIELIALALADNRKRILHFAAGALGAAGLFAVYETGEHGGELVYNYAGGVGLRSGNPDDVGRLLLAGMYQQAMLDRREKRGDAAAALFGQMATRYPHDFAVQLLAAESVLRDKNDGAGAVAALNALSPADDRAKRSVASIKADAYIALGQKDSARTLLEDLLKQQPTNLRLKARLDSLK